MTNDEHYKLAMKIMEGILAEVEKPRGIEAPENPFKLIRWEPPPGYELLGINNTHLFYELDCEQIGIEVRLFTECAAVGLLGRSIDNLEKFLANATVIDKEGQTHKIGDVVSPALRSQLLEKLTEHTILGVISHLKIRAEDVLDELVNEVSLRAQISFLSEFYKEFGELGVVDYHLEYVVEEYERTIAETVANKRASLKNSFKDLWRPYLEEIGEHYHRVLPMWQDAKLLYRQNKERPSWRDIVKAAHSELKEYDDLISRLSGKLNDLPEEIQAKLSEKGGGSKPSSIALEHAARLCGAVPYEYSVRYLYYSLRKYNNGERDEYS